MSSQSPVSDHSFRLPCVNLGLAYSIILDLLLIAGAGSPARAQSPLDDVNTAISDRHEVATSGSPTDAGLERYSGSPLRVNADLVLIPVTVADARDRPVLELSKQDFGLYDSGKRQDIKYFFAEAAPISIRP